MANKTNKANELYEKVKNEKIVMSWKGVDYTLVFNLNVMEEIQEEYGSVGKWGALTDNAQEPNAKAVIFGLTAMINEGIDIDNEENQGKKSYKPKEFLTKKQVGRMLTEVGLEDATASLNDAVIKSVASDEKN